LEGGANNKRGRKYEGLGRRLRMASGFHSSKEFEMIHCGEKAFKEWGGMGKSTEEKGWGTGATGATEGKRTVHWKSSALSQLLAAGTLPRRCRGLTTKEKHTHISGGGGGKEVENKV